MVKLTADLSKILNKQYGKRNKYGNIKAQCLSKHLHDSKLEANYCNRLLAQQQKKEIISYGIQKKFSLEVNFQLICMHIVDFYICTKYENEIYQYEVHDTKGVATKDWIIKRKLFQALYPNILYKVITNH